MDNNQSIQSIPSAKRMKMDPQYNEVTYSSRRSDTGKSASKYRYFFKNSTYITFFDVFLLLFSLYCLSHLIWLHVITVPMI